MAAWYFLICFLAIPSCLVSGQSPTFGLKGGKVFLKPDITGHPDGILWKFKGNKVVEFDGQQQQVFRPYENRITLNWVTAELNIADLRSEDSGDYVLEVEINNALRTSYYALEVMDKVSRPTISCKMNDGGSLNVSGELVCSAEPQPSLKFEWGARGNVQLGPQLQIPLGDEHDDEVYSCSVSNQLSKETTTFTAKDCYPEGSSSAVPITIAVIIVLVLLLGCVAIHCLKRHNKACFAEEDDLEKQSLSGCKEDEMTKQEEIPNKGLVERVKKRLGLEGSNKREGQNNVKRSLVHRESTLPSKQKLFQGNKYRRTNTFSDKQNKATDLDHKEPVKEAEAQSTPLVEAPPAAQALSPLTKISLHTAPKDPAGGLKDVANSGQVTGDSAQNEVGESESGEGKRNESEDSTDHKQRGSTASIGTDVHLSQGENNTSKESQTVNVKPVSQDEDESKTNTGTQEEAESHQHLNSANSEQLQSPRTKPDHSNTDAGPESSDTKPAQPEAPPTAQTLSPLTESSLNTAPKDPAGEQKDVTNSGQVTRDSAENEDGESDSSGEGKRNESDDSGEDKPMSTDPEQRGSRTSKEPEENNTSKESQKVNVKPVPEGEDISKRNAGDHEETDTQQHLNSANSEQLQSPRTKPDHSNTDAGPESSDTKPAQPEAPLTAQALSPLTEISVNTAPKDPAGEQKDVTNSGQVTRDSAENEDGESDSSGEGKRNESDDSGEDKPMSTDPEQRGSRTSKEPEENNTSKESQKVNVKPVPEGEDISKRNAGDHEETDTQQHLNSANSEQLQSPRTKPDHSNTDAGPESSDTKPAQPEAPLTAQALSPLTEISVNTAPKDPAGGLKDVANSGQVTGDSAQNKVSVYDSSGEGKRNESDDSGEDKLMSTPTDSDHEDPEMIKQGHVQRRIERFGLEGKDDHQGGDADAVTHKEPPQEKEPLINQSDRVEENDPEPAGVSDHASEDKKSSPESPEHPEPVKEAEAQSTPCVEAPPAAQALSPLNESSLNTAPKDPAGGLKDVANSGQVTGDSAQNEVGESESGEGKINESEDSTDHKQRGSTASIGTDIQLSQGENNTSKESQTVNVKPVSQDEDTSKTNTGSHEEAESHQHLNSANSEQLQSPRTKPDHSNTDAGPESSDTKPAQPDEEEEERETSTDSQDTEGQSDEGEDKTVEDRNEA
ncbi:uncharacterized protein LOC120834442 isoform X2 [Gasterosteus aculeatus]